MDTTKYAIEKLEPTKIVKIMLKDLTVPIDTASELSRLAVVEKDIILHLFTKAAESEDDAEEHLNLRHALKWVAEYRHLNVAIHGMTKGAQEKAMMKSFEVQGDLYRELIKKLPNDRIVEIVNELKETNANSRDSNK